MLCPPTLPRSHEYVFQLYILSLYPKCRQVIKLRTLRKNKALAAETVVSEDIFKTSKSKNILTILIHTTIDIFTMTNNTQLR